MKVGPWFCFSHFGYSAKSARGSACWLFFSKVFLRQHSHVFGLPFASSLVFYTVLPRSGKTCPWGGTCLRWPATTELFFYVVSLTKKVCILILGWQSISTKRQLSFRRFYTWPGHFLIHCCRCCCFHYDVISFYPIESFLYGYSSCFIESLNFMRTTMHVWRKLQLCAHCVKNFNINSLYPPYTSLLPWTAVEAHTGIDPQFFLCVVSSGPDFSNNHFLKGIVHRSPRKSLNCTCPLALWPKSTEINHRTRFPGYPLVFTFQLQIYILRRNQHRFTNFRQCRWTM